MAHWYLVRHGETEWNAQERVQGQTDVPLSGVGREQAARTAQRLAGCGFGAVYASDLVRAQETARIIVARGSEPRPEVRHRPSLREIAYGVLEGERWEEVRAFTGELRDSQGTYHDLDLKPEGGESFRELLERLAGFARELEASHQDSDALVVSHGGALRALAVGLLGLPPDAFWRMRGLLPASVSVIRHDEGFSTLTAWNDVGHLL